MEVDRCKLHGWKALPHPTEASHLLERFGGSNALEPNNQRNPIGAFPVQKAWQHGSSREIVFTTALQQAWQTWMAVYWRASNKRMRTNPPIFCFFFQHTHQHGIEAISATRGWDRVIFASQIAGRLLCHCCYSPLLLILFHQNNNQR